MELKGIETETQTTYQLTATFPFPISYLPLAKVLHEHCHRTSIMQYHKSKQLGGVPNCLALVKRLVLPSKGTAVCRNSIVWSIPTGSNIIVQLRNQWLDILKMHTYKLML